VDIGADEYQSGAVDTTPPVITLIGSDPFQLEVGTTYVEPGATAIDDVDGDISANIAIDSSAVNTGTVGSYQVTYNISDAAGNPAIEVIRTVNVVDTTAPVIVMTTPPDGATNVAVDTQIVITVIDSGSGVNDATFSMTVEGSSVSATPGGTLNNRTFTYDPGGLAYNLLVNITVSVEDNAGNPSTDDSLSFRTAVGGLPPGDDEDGDGIPNGDEDPTLGTNPYTKTLFVRPHIETASGYEFWEGFGTLFPDSRGSAFADIPPFTNAGIEISIIGDPNHAYAPMRDYNFDPAVGGPHPPCDILEVYYMALSPE
jgi:hypothetical protein